MPESIVKCVVWDLDETLWNGTISEDETVAVTAESTRLVCELDQCGILNSIASRNEVEPASEELARADLEKFFICPQFGFGPKSQALKKIAEYLNIRLEHICFLDDQKFERAEVAAAFPEVRCFDVSSFATYWREIGSGYSRTPVAIQRRLLYKEEALRKDAERDAIGSHEDFLHSLDIRMKIRESGQEDWPRIHELLIRTNQFNSAGSGADTDIVRKALEEPQLYLALSISLSDRFGAYGDVGFCLIRHDIGALLVLRLAFSCRVLSRGVGQAFLGHLVRSSTRSGGPLLVEVLNSEKNRQLDIALRISGFSELTTHPTLILQAPEELATSSEHIKIDDAVLSSFFVARTRLSTPSTVMVVGGGI